MDRRIRQALLSALLLAAAIPAAAQFYPVEYRPPGLGWQQLTTDHFRIVYPSGADSAARATARLLESHYRRAQALVGGELRDFPVILRSYNDRSNGFVTSLHFRSEIDLSPAAGKSLNPRSGSWLETVAPHELVHALQFSNLGGFTIPSVVGLFAPDLGRSFHGAIPSGINEGIAVHHETAGGLPGGGRGNLAWFGGRYRSLYGTPEEWSMGQMVHSSTYTRPYDRHYIGGYFFTSWLQREFGEELTREALDFYVRFPFLGYGFALRHATGSWPSQLHDRFERAYADSLEATFAGGPGAAGSERGAPPAGGAAPGHRLLDLPYRGTSARHPIWTDDSTLVFHGSFYNARTGFYRYGLSSERLQQLQVTGSVPDYHFDLSNSGDSLLYAFYRPSTTYDNAYRADLALYGIGSGRNRPLSHRRSLFSPVHAGEEILALQNDGASTRLVRFDPGSGETELLLDGGPVLITDLSVDPGDPGRIALIANRRGMQALWILEREDLPVTLPDKPDIAFAGGSVYDPDWHPRRDLLLFSSDRSGTLQLYEYSLDDGAIYQLTEGPQNAFEGNYSPSGDRIAYVVQHRNEQRLAVMDRPASPAPLLLPSADTAPDGEISDRMERPLSGSDIDTTGWERDTYRTGFGWLRPRIMLPVYDELSNRGIYELGLSFHSSDLLQQQSYDLDITEVQDRFWYDLTYRNARFFPGYELGVSSAPSYRDFRFIADQDTVDRTLLRQQREFSLAVPFRWVLENNVFFSSITLRPELARSQVRYFELRHAGSAASDFANITIGKLFASLNYRLQQNVRDVQPNSGLVMYGQLEHYFNSETLLLRTLDEQFQLSFSDPSALRAGFFTWLSPLRRHNQSLRLGAEFLTQSGPVFDTQSVVSDAFRDPVLALSNNLVSLETRYTIPLLYPDDGGFLLPLYLENFYLAAFSDTVFDPTEGGLSSSQTVFGLELRSRFRLSNLSLDIGIGVGYEPSRDRFGFIFSF